MFKDRDDAARQLAIALDEYRGGNTVIIALARGGIALGYRLAVALNAELYVLVVRKIGAPGNPELAVGAITNGENPHVYIDEELVSLLHVDPEYLDRRISENSAEIKRRKALYSGQVQDPEIKGKTAIITDDGIATGSTVKVAIEAVRQWDPERCVLAVPVAPPDTIKTLQPTVDTLVCLHQPAWFHSVGQYYQEFPQLRDEDVVRLLKAYRNRHGN